MATRKSSKPKNDAMTANLGFEVELWAAADVLPSMMDSWAQPFIFDLAASCSSGAWTARRCGVL